MNNLNKMQNIVFNDIKPRTRAERVSHPSDLITPEQAAMKDRERIEMVRLQERTGGYHKYTDSAFIHNPDPTSHHYISGNSPFSSLSDCLCRV